MVKATGPLTPPPGAPGAFALSDEDNLRDFASSAGLMPVAVFDVDCRLRWLSSAQGRTASLARPPTRPRNGRFVSVAG